ncbi:MULTISPECIES: DUF6475 domain-containing protein [unclassified Caballeronia]|uniref:DUF6475 domain-containing protein n=1 Tax=unclassified Caballeronia TaxID=2646786 RepID=UPI00202844C7|nr:MULTISPECIES: DUF6475 domain-containing protein [unclassified Caballeronia]
MRPTDHAQFFELVGNVYAFYRQDYSKFAGSVWLEAMKPYDFAAVADALNRHCVNPDNGQFMPKPADIVRMLEGSTQDSGMVAWSKVDTAIRQRGTYVSVVFDDPIIHRVILDMGGWVLVGGKDADEWPFVAKEFVNRYRGYKMRSETPDYPPVLIGMAEAQNNRQGFESGAPVLIGNAEQAKRVLSGGTEKPLIAFTQMVPAEAARLRLEASV